MTDSWEYSLENMEVSFTLAHPFRKFEMTLRETSEADMERKDCGGVTTMGDLKVSVREVKD